MFHELRKVFFFLKKISTELCSQDKSESTLFEVEIICGLLIIYSANSLNQKQYPNWYIEMLSKFSDKFLSKLFLFKGNE